MSGPHDRFVRYTLGQPERAAAELRAALPARLAALVDWSTLRREPSNVVKLLWVALRYGKTPDLARQLKELEVLFAQVRAASSGEEELRMVVQYLFWVGDVAARQALEGVLNSSVGPQHTEELMQTVGEKLFAQGEAKGEAKGIAKGAAEGRAKYLLQTLARRGIDVDAKTRRRIRACKDTRLLDQWFDRAWTASTLAEVLGEPSE